MENNPLAEHSECAIRNAVLRLKGLQDAVGAGELNGDLGMAIQALDYFRGLAAEREREDLIKNGVKRLFTGPCDGDHMQATVRYVLKNRTVDKVHIVTSANRKDRGVWEEIFNTEGYHSSIVTTSWNRIEDILDVSGAFFIFDGNYVYGRNTWAKYFLRIAKQNDWIAVTEYKEHWLDYTYPFVASGFFRNRAEYLRKHIVFDEHCRFPKVKGVNDVCRLVEMLDSILVRDLARPLPYITESDPA